MNLQTILVVDDEPGNLAIMRDILADSYRLVFARNGSETLAAVAKHSPAMVLLDVGLPDINGFDVLTRIRQHPILRSIPVIMLTAQSTREDVLHGLSGGADGYITKPFEHEILMTGIRSVLGIE